MKKMKMTVGEPICVAQGPTYEEVSWGPWQFPTIGTTDDGAIIVTCAAGQDNEVDADLPPHAFESYDGGQTWAPCDPSRRFEAYPKAPSGDRILPQGHAPRAGLDEVFEGAPVRWHMECDWANYEFYRYGDLHLDKLPPHFEFIRVRPSTATPEVYYAKVEDPDDMTVIKTTNGTTLPSISGRLRVAPDGALWVGTYCRPYDPKSETVLPIFTVQFYRSADNGATWKLASTVTPEKCPEAGYFCEPDIAWTKDGGAVTLLRANGCWAAYSPDGGYTWETPVKFDDIGVYPAICSLPCGATLASYGRPGFFLRASYDPEIRQWEERYTLIGDYDHTPEMNEKVPSYPGHSWGTCSYSDILPLSDDEVMVVYTDFFLPDEKGVKRKSLMVVKVKFGED